MKKTKRLLFAICLLIVSATLLGTASYAWFSMNTEVGVDGIRVEAYSDSLFLEISKTGADDEFATNVDFTSNGEVALRLAKHGFVGEKVYTLAITPGTGRYVGTNPGYYKLIAATSDSFQKYVKAEVGTDLVLGTSLADLYEELAFVKQTSGKAATGVTYYELVAGKYVPAALTVGVSDVKGYYTLTAETAATKANYEGGATQYYAKGADGSYSNVTSTLVQGTDLSAFCTIVATEVAATAAEGDVYLAGTGDADDEYAYLGNYATATDISDALYFGRAYSDVIADGDLDDTLNIIKKASANGTYFYKETVYVRNALNTNDSKNLTATITVGGAENEIAKALRVLLVVTDFTSGTPGDRVNTVYYDNVTRVSEYGDGETNIVDVLYGNKAETLKVDIYVYFDGTDEIAENSKITAGVLNGQTVAIEFNVDDHAYNEPVTP